VHEGLTEMRGTTAPRLLLELVCARMLLPATDGSAAATLQRLERLERRMSIAGEHAGRPVAEPGSERVVERAPDRVERPGAEEPPAPAPSGGPRREYVRPSQARAAAPSAPATPATPAAAPADDWPETVKPGSGAATPPSAPPATTPAPSALPSRPAGATSEPDVPLPPEPTDDEDWPHPARPAAAAAAAERLEQPRPQAAAPRAAAEHSPAPRGAEPTPVVSAGASGQAADGELTTTDVRRIWPELLAVVKRHKRTTEALLKNAQVHELAGGVLTLSTQSPALARRISDDLNKDVLREALNELLGVRWRVEAVVEGAATPGAPAVPPEVARQQARAAEAAEASELLAQRAAEGAGEEPAAAVDPEQAALSLLRAQLGARPVDE
jgi:DNA polymerase-3 subunit gamma/tau